MKKAESIVEYVELIHDHRIGTGRNWIIDAIDKALSEAYSEGKAKGRLNGIHEAVEACWEWYKKQYISRAKFEDTVFNEIELELTEKKGI